MGVYSITNGLVVSLFKKKKKKKKYLKKKKKKKDPTRIGDTTINPYAVVISVSTSNIGISEGHR